MSVSSIRLTLFRVYNEYPMGNVEARQKRRGSSLILQEDDLNTIERQYNAMCAGHSHIDKRAFEVSISLSN